MWIAMFVSCSWDDWNKIQNVFFLWSGNPTLSQMIVSQGKLNKGNYDWLNKKLSIFLLQRPLTVHNSSSFRFNFYLNISTDKKALTCSCWTSQEFIWSTEKYQAIQKKNKKMKAKVFYCFNEERNNKILKKFLYSWFNFWLLFLWM